MRAHPPTHTPVGQRPQQGAQVFFREAATVEVVEERLRAPLEGRAAVAVPSNAVPLRQLLVAGTHAQTRRRKEVHRSERKYTEAIERQKKYRT